MAKKKAIYQVGRPHKNDVRVWLLTYGYPDVRDMIDTLINRWTAEGKHTRRNWWDILAGDEKGNPRTVAGIAFPVLRAARRRKGWPDVPNATCRSEAESIPPVRIGIGRWPRKRARKK